MKEFGKVYDIQRFAVHDGPGIRTNIFLKGCPLRCLWCHSPESQSFETQLDLSKNENIGRNITADDCLKTIQKDVKYYQQSGGGVTISGGEPISQFAFCKSLAAALKAEGYHVALDTSGYASTDLFAEIYPYTDLFLYDIKCIDAEKHLRLTGVTNELILENAYCLAKLGTHFQFRLPIIPGFNDSAEDMKRIARFICGIRDIQREESNGGTIDLIQLLPYHSLGENKYQKIGRVYDVKINPPTDEFLQKQLLIFRALGFNAQVG